MIDLSHEETQSDRSLEALLRDYARAAHRAGASVEVTAGIGEWSDLHWYVDAADLYEGDLLEGEGAADGATAETVGDDVTTDDTAAGETTETVDDDVTTGEIGDLDAGAVRQVMAGLVGLGMPERAAEQVLSMAVGVSAARAAVVGSVRDQRLVDGVEATLLLSRSADAAMLGMVRDLAVVAGEKVLAQQGVTSVEELSATGRVHWRARTKSALATELSALTGWGIQSCHDRVGLALAPTEVSDRAQWALSRGWQDLWAVTDFWRRARNLPVDQAALVAEQVLGPVPDGDGVPVRPSREQFSARLHRAVVAAEGADAAAARRRRRVALDTRDATAVLDDNGTATFSVIGGTSAVAAAMVRVDSVARRARHHGDERSIAQLRADLALALLVHGTLPGKEPDDKPESDQSTNDERGSDEAADDEPTRRQADSDEPETEQPRSEQSGHPDAGRTEQQHRRESRPAPADGDRPGDVEPVHNEPEPVHNEPLIAEPGPGLRAALGTSAAQVNLEIIVPLDALLDPDSTAVAHLPGFGPISAEHAREIALTEGTTIHRLLTDPADGRCVERSIGSYRPDQAMLDQLRAADRTCRGPGCTRDVARAQPDHAQPWRVSRWTSELNLAYEHSHHHHNLTLGLWACELRADRTITFRSLFDRVYTTRAHDYRDYHPLDVAITPAETGPAAGGQASSPSGIDPDLAGRLIYAALAHRAPGDRLADDLDEEHTCDDSARPTLAELRAGRDYDVSLFELRHHSPGGAPRPGAPPGHPTVRDIVHPPDQDPPPAPPPGPPPPF